MVMVEAKDFKVAYDLHVVEVQALLKAELRLRGTPATKTRAGALGVDFSGLVATVKRPGGRALYSALAQLADLSSGRRWRSKRRGKTRSSVA